MTKETRGDIGATAQTYHEIDVAEGKRVYRILMDAKREVELAEKRIKALDKDINMPFAKQRRLLAKQESRYYRNRTIVTACCKSLDLPLLRFLPWK